MKFLSFGVFLCAIMTSQAHLTEDTVESLDKVIDVVLNLVRVDNGLHHLFNLVKIPESLTQDGITFHNLTLTNILNLYRDGESTIDLDADKLVTNTTFEVKNFSVNAEWNATKWFVTLEGTAKLNFDSLSLNTVIGVEGLQVSLIDAEVPEIGHIECTEVTGTSVVFNGLVKDLAEKILNLSSTKQMITTQLVANIREIFSKIFK